jgi:sortase (surface protein transpeptidase)
MKAGRDLALCSQALADVMSSAVMDNIQSELAGHRDHASGRTFIKRKLKRHGRVAAPQFKSQAPRER